jgi:CheY-like chemotaxis protein
LKHTLETAPGTLPDLILLDINMPVMNGWDFLDLYAALEAELPKKICIVMLSSTVDQADYDRANTYSQVSGFHSKPLTKENLPDIAALVESSR